VTEPQWEDQVWRTAVEWVIRSHGTLGPADLKELSKWLKAHPFHQEAYEEATRLWLLTGLVPPSNPPSNDG
jgi:ferric-dicitrate binding protein FerR (iron transport regulator)